MSPLLDHLLHSGELVVFFGIAWRIVRLLNRHESLQRDYPPHRHIAGKIIYPKEFQPAKTESLEG